MYLKRSPDCLVPCKAVSFNKVNRFRPSVSTSKSLPLDRLSASLSVSSSALSLSVDGPSACPQAPCLLPCGHCPRLQGAAGQHRPRHPPPADGRQAGPSYALPSRCRRSNTFNMVSGRSLGRTWARTLREPAARRKAWPRGDAEITPCAVRGRPLRRPALTSQDEYEEDTAYR